jgi:hypothetical protein
MIIKLRTLVVNRIEPEKRRKYARKLNKIEIFRHGYKALS